MLCWYYRGYELDECMRLGLYAIYLYNWLAIIKSLDAWSKRPKYVFHNIARRVRLATYNYRRSSALNYCAEITFLYSLIPPGKFIVRLFPIFKLLSKRFLLTIPSFVIWNWISEAIFYFSYQTFNRYGRIFLYRVHHNRKILVGIKIDMICRLHGWQTHVWFVNLSNFPMETPLAISSL